MSTFLRYLKFQAMMFVFGIVGPIFLALYFGSQPDPTLKWAFWAGLFITAADVLIALALTSATDSAKPSVGHRVAVRTSRRMQGRDDTGNDHTSPATVFEPFAAAGFPSNESWSTSTESWSTSSDYGPSSSDCSPSSDSGWSSSSDSGSCSSDSGSSSSDSGSSSSSSD